MNNYAKEVVIDSKFVSLFLCKLVLDVLSEPLRILWSSHDLNSLPLT